MPKATLTFKLPEEQEEFHLTLKAGAYASVIEDLADHLRSKLKYADLTAEQEVIYEELRSYFNALRVDRGIL